MISWHERSCFRPDVSLVDSSPFCMSCGSLASLDDLDAGQAPPPPPIPSQRQAGLALSWPSSVTYSASFVSDDEDLTSQLVEIAASAASQSYDMDISYGMDIDDDATSDTEGTLTGDEGPHGDPVPKAWAKREREHMDELVGTDCIRILRLGKGKGTDPLHGVLQVRQLKYFPEYEALSYTWADANGNANRTKKLYLGSSWDITPITPNCEAALRSLRLPTKERYIWVDALCINHTRVQERSSQVQLMPVIYATAQRVLVYLGDDRPSVDIKSSRLKAGWNGWEDRWNEMDENLKRPYFFRSWIIQEIAMAKSALVTDGKSWRVWPIHNDLKETKTFLPWISHFDKRKYKTPNDLVQLVIDSWTSQASDPRDKVFALLGVISGAAADGLIADYSLSMEHVYTGFASFALQKLGAISLLKYAGGYEKSPGLPSWVPDWRQLSQDWAIMARIKLFHSRTEIEHLALSRNIALERTELLTRPWPPGPNTLGRSDIYIHSQTGALCVSGISLVELPSPLDLEPSKETFLVFKAEGFFIVAPITAKEGDVVFFLHGLNSPVILRSRGANIFSFVGMCYARIRRGISMHRKGIGQDRFDVLYLKARTRGLAVHIPKEWTHSKPQCNTLVRDAARELLEAQAGAYDVEQESSLEAIGKEAERTWTYVLQTNLPVVLMMPDLSPKDLVAPVPHLLGELKEAVGNLVQMWAETVAYLEACLRPDNVPSEEWAEMLAFSRRLETRNANILVHELDADSGLLSSVDEDVQDELKAWYSTPFTPSGGSTLGSFDPLTERDADPDAFCPRWCWYQRPEGRRSWYTMVRKQTKLAAEHVQLAVPEVERSEPVALTYVPVRITVEESLAEAREWQAVFECAMEEIEVVKRAVEMLLAQRQRYRMLTTSAGWRRIAIV